MIQYHKNMTAWLICSVVSALFCLTGCRTASIPVEVTVPGEFNLSGVSKIAVVNFNSLLNDPLKGIYSADEETLSLAQNMVSSAFYKCQMYQVADLDIERAISQKSSDLVRVGQKFDAIMYGRVWWQVSPEYMATYPKVYTLESWKNVKYDTGRKDLYKKPIYDTAKVTTRKKDTIGTQYFRAKNVSLMLSLTLYRVDHDGKLEKITDSFAVASEKFLIDNGAFSFEVQEFGADNSGDRASRLQAAAEDKSFFGSLFSSKEDANAVSTKFVTVQNTETIPTDLQTKMALIGKLSAELNKKISPSTVKFDIPSDVDDDKLFNLLKDGAFNAAQEYIVYTIRKEYGNAIADEISPLSSDVYPIPDNLVPAEDPDPEKITEKKVLKAANNYRDFLYALAICEEAQSNYEKAIETYRYVFELKPTKEYALGISRCLYALGMTNRVNEKAKAQKKAAAKADMED